MRRDPRAVRFVDWWARNREDYDPINTFWTDGLLWYFGPEIAAEEDGSATALLDLFADAAAEYHAREARDPGVWGRWSEIEPEGMIVTDFESIPDDDRVAA